MSAISGNYYTLSDSRILREYKDQTGVYQYMFVDSIPEERIGGAKEIGFAIKSTVSTVLDFIPVVSNIKGAIEASVGEDIITGREIGNVEWGILVAAIFGGPIVKGVQKLGKAAMSQLPKVKNVLNPDKAKSFAKDFYDDYIKKGIHSGYSAVNSLAKKVVDMPLPLSPKLAIANGMSVAKTIGESMTEAKETFVQMAGKVKESVSGKDIDNPLLPGEGKVGTYEELIDAGTRGDNITPHHMPSAKYMKTNAEVHKNDGASMNMEHPYPGKGGRHRQTETYGMAGKKLEDYLNLEPRDALARDIIDARNVYIKEGLYTPEMRSGLLEVIKLNKTKYPNHF